MGEYQIRSDCDDLEFNSFKSHLDARLSKIYDEFFLFPFKYFNEHEIHYWFVDLQNKLRKEDKRHFEMSIIREYPTKMRYKKIDGKQLITDPKGRSGHIDVVITYKDKYRIGYEFFFGKETPEAQLDMNDDKYFFKRSSLSPTQALLHTKNDIIKLKDETNLDFSYVLIFVATFHNSEKKRERFLRKRKKIIDGLKDIQPQLTEKIKIYYFEKGYVSNFDTGKYYLYAISNRPGEDNFYPRDDGIL